MPQAAPPFAELLCRTAFSLLEGTSSPEDCVERAAALGLHALAIADRDAVYGLPRAFKAAQGQIKLINGARLTVRDNPGLVLLARDATGWKNLCHLITRARGGDPKVGVSPRDPAAWDGPYPPEASTAKKGRASLPLEAVLAAAEGLEAVLCGDWLPERAEALREAFGGHASLAVSRRLDGADDTRLARARSRAALAGLPLLATADPLMHHPDNKRLQDVLTCMRLHCTLEQAGRALQANAARALASPAAMARLFRGEEAALARSVEVADRCTFSLGDLRWAYPREVVPADCTPMDWLRRLTDQGLGWRYPDGVPPQVRAAADRELALIDKLNFPAYFLTVYDAVRFARERGILCQGRGSAANSAVCYALGVTSVDPSKFSLLFERFISEERGEPPDIDVDFEHERREEVIQYIYQKYGRHRAGMVSAVVTWRRRSAVREVGKVFGLSLDQVDRLARLTRWKDGGAKGPHEGGEEPEVQDGPERAISAEDVTAAGLDARDPGVVWTLQMAGELSGLPRHMSIHTGGFTLSDGPLVDLVPVEPASMQGRTIIQWDKDDLDIVRFVKVDLLALGMLTAIRKAFDLLAVEATLTGRPPVAVAALPERLDLAAIPHEDDAVFDMLGRADTLGVFQVESRAQISMLPRLLPRTFYDLVIEISLVRPGPIQGGMVHPYLRRRTGKEPIDYAHPKLVPILERTLGVPIFQEQVMSMAVAVGGFSPGQADELRRAMGAWRKKGKLDALTAVLRENMKANGISEAFSDQICQQIAGFGEYGFPESHAASFARLVWVSSWLRCHHPAVFLAALLNSQPMGFYSPRSIVADAQRHGVPVRTVDVQHSDWDCTLEPSPPTPLRGPPPDGHAGPAIRLGFREVTGVGEAAGRAIADARRQGGPFRDAADLSARTGLPRDVLSRLARADALRALRPEGRPAATGAEIDPDWNRRQALWTVQGLNDLPLFRGLSTEEEAAPLPTPSPVEELEADYRATGLSVDRHPLGLARAMLRRQGVVTATALEGRKPGDIVRVAGLVTHRQRPGTAKGMVFMTLEDETGLINLAVRPDLFEKQRALIIGADLLKVRAKVQRDGGALTLLAQRFFELPYAPLVGQTSRNFR